MSENSSVLIGFKDRIGKERKITITFDVTEEKEIIDSIEELDSWNEENYLDEENYKIAKKIIKNGGEVIYIDNIDVMNNFRESICDNYNTIELEDY